MALSPRSPLQILTHPLNSWHGLDEYLPESAGKSLNARRLGGYTRPSWQSPRVPQTAHADADSGDAVGHGCGPCTRGGRADTHASTGGGVRASAAQPPPGWLGSPHPAPSSLVANERVVRADIQVWNKSAAEVHFGAHRTAHHNPHSAACPWHTSTTGPSRLLGLEVMTDTRYPARTLNGAAVT